MKVHLSQIPQGATLHAAGEESAAGLDLEAAGAQPTSPLRYDLDVGMSEGGIFATGRIGVGVLLRCVACLETFDHAIAIEDFAMQRELEGHEAVDLTPEVREDIQLALPSYPRCDADGRKSCPARFPRPAANAPVPSGNAAWEALDQLKKRKLNH